MHLRDLGRCSALSWLYDSLTIAGFDIVHLDFREAKLSLQENEINLLRTIRWINDENPSAEITLIGASMGGVIAKMAINDLAKAGCCYPIVGYGSFDVPHRGAFIPIGLQAASKYYAELLPFVPVKAVPLATGPSKTRVSYCLTSSRKYFFGSSSLAAP